MGQNENPAVKNQDEIEIDLLELLRAIWSNIGLVIISALLLGIIALAVTIFFIKPTYRANLTAFVNNRTSEQTMETIGSGDVTAARSLTYTYAAIIKSRPVIEDSLSRASLQSRYSYDSIKNSITTSIEDNTQLDNVYVTLKSPEDAYMVAKAISEVAPAYVSNIVEGSSMKIVTNPVLPTTQYSPNPRKNMMIGILLGIVLMAAYIVIRELLDNRVKSEQELEEKFGLPIVGSIPNFKAASSGKNYGYSSYYKKGGAN